MDARPISPPGGIATKEIFLDAGLVVLVLLAVFSPAWNVFIAWNKVPELVSWVEVRRGATVLEQLANPFAPIADPIHRIVQWRLLFPMLAHVLHLPGSVLLFAAPTGAYAGVVAIVALARWGGRTRREAAGGALILGAAGWFFVSTGWLGYFDGWLVVGLIMVSHARRRAVVWTACLLVPWVDERFLLSMPLALSVRLMGAKAAGPGLLGPAGERLTMLGAASICLGCVAARIWLSGHGGSLEIFEYLREQQTLKIGALRHVFGAWESLRLGWVFVVLGCWKLILPLRASSLGFAFVFLLTLAAGPIIANDLSRAMTGLMPVAVEGLLGGTARRCLPPRVLAGIALLALLVPAHHVVTDFTRPIRSFPSVYRAWRHPSGDLAAMSWADGATRLRAAGRSEEAAHWADRALRLDTECAGAYNVRGILAADDGRWQAAFSDFELACRFEPGNASFWVNLGAVARTLGHHMEARRALETLRGLARADPKVGPQLAELEAALGTAP